MRLFGFVIMRESKLLDIYQRQIDDLIGMLKMIDKLRAQLKPFKRKRGANGRFVKKDGENV